VVVAIFGEDARRPEKGVVTGAGLPWHFTVAKPPAMTGHARASHCDEVLHLGTWHPSGRRPTPARLSRSTMRLVGTMARAEQCLKLILSARFFTEDHYPRLTGRESRSEITDGEGAEPVILFSHCTMVITIRASDRASFRAQISIFFVITCLSSCDKVVDL
jgi:hypothetical protein